MVRPKLFLDTNICINAANGSIPADEWRRVRKYVGGNYRYYISYITMKELFGKLARGADEAFERNKQALHILFGPGKRSFLPYPSVFALRTVLGRHSASRQPDDLDMRDEDWAKTVLAAVLQAPSKGQLMAGIPMRKRITPRILSFDLDHFDRHENEPQNEHADLLQGIREDRIDMPSRMKWAAWILHQHDFEPYTADCERLVGALDAAYCFSSALARMTKDKGYDFHKHATDWGDATQLFYLCDPLMHFLTADKTCRQHTAGSSQSCRILLWREFVASVP